MARIKSWVLTDITTGTYQSSWSLHDSDVQQATPAPWSIHKRTLRGGNRDGVDLIEVRNGALSFSVVPTRGMGLWRGQYRGHALGWQSPVLGPVHPKLVNLADRGGLGWLHGFDEWVCRCGLSSMGPPGADPASKEFLPLHGRIANSPAHYVEVQVDLDPPHELSIIGEVDEACLFFSRLRLVTRYRTTPGSNRLVIEDQIENLRSSPAEFELLYHCQFGAPFLEAGSRVRAPIREVAPSTEHAAQGMNQFDTYLGPTPGFAEQVYFYDLHATAEGNTLALLHNAHANLGVTVRMNKAQMPRFIVWKNTAAMQDGYVTGLEPATNYPNPRWVERDRGRLIKLPPDERYTSALTIEVHDTPAGVAAVLHEIERIQGSVTPKAHKSPRADW